MEGRLYLRLLLRNRLPIAVLVVLALVLGGVLYAVAPATYRSSMTFAVQSDAGSSEPSEVYQAELLSQARAQTYARLVTGRTLVNRVRRVMTVPVSANRLAGDISASAAQGSVLLHVDVTDQSAAVVNSASKALATEFPRYVADLEGARRRNITSADLATAPTAAQQTGPSKVRYFGLALLAGLIVALLIAVIREATNRRLRDVEDVRSVVGPGPAVVELYRAGRLPRRRQPDSAVVLSRVVAHAAAEGRAVALVPLPAGRPAAAATLGLARRLAVGGQRVGLIDADVDGRYLTTLAASDAEVAVLDGTTAAGGGSAPVVVVPADVVLELAAADHAPGPSAPRVDLRTVGTAVGKATAALQDDVDLVLVAAGGVLFRARPAFLSAEAAEAILLVRRREATKTELAAAMEVLRRFDCPVGAVALVGDLRGRRDR